MALRSKVVMAELDADIFSSILLLDFLWVCQYVASFHLANASLLGARLVPNFPFS